MRRTFLTKLMQRSMLLAMILSMVWFATPSKADPCSFTATPTPIASTEVFPGNCTGNSIDMLLASVTTPWTLSTGLASGSLTAAVYREPGGTLDFYYQITNNATSRDSIERNADINFTGYLDQGTAFRTDCGTTGCGAGFVDGTVAPFTADRTTDSTVGFDFVGSAFGASPITPGTTSNVVIITTTAPAFTDGFASVIDGNGIATVPAFQPLPEPMSFILVGPGLVGLGLLRRKKRNP